MQQLNRPLRVLCNLLRSYMCYLKSLTHLASSIVSKDIFDKIHFMGRISMEIMVANILYIY